MPEQKKTKFISVEKLERFRARLLSEIAGVDINLNTNIGGSNVNYEDLLDLSMPSEYGGDLTEPDMRNDEEYSFTAPCDGWITVSGMCLNPGSIRLKCGPIENIIWGPAFGANLSLSLPIRKDAGAVAEFHMIDTSTMKIEFFYTMGTLKVLTSDGAMDDEDLDAIEGGNADS